MLQSIRDKITGWVAGLFLVVISVVFVFWGINFESSSSTYALKVNGEKVPIETVTRAWQQRLSQLQQMMRDELPESMRVMQQQALMDEFVRRTLLSQRAEQMGYRVSDAALAKQIVEFPQLQVDGEFSRDRYAMLLRQQGRSETQFEAELRSDMAIQQIQQGIVDTAFVAPYELDRRYALEKQQREVNYALIPTSDFTGQVAVTGEQIQAWYDTHKSSYLLPESVDLKYIELTRAQAESRVEVTEEALEQYYEQVKERFESPERRQARHVLIAVDGDVNDEAARKKAEELAAEAKGGADFAELAKENSQDPGSAQQGGDLGWAQRGMFVGPFEDALFAMQPGEIRGPIKTQFGYHIIKLEKIESGHVRPFAEVRAEIEADYRKDRAQTIFYDESQKLADQAFDSLTELDSVSQAMNLQVKTISAFTREGGGGLANPEVIEAAFSEDVLERGQNSPLIAVGEDRAMVLRVANHQPSQAKPLAEVREQIETELRTNAAREAAQAKAAAVLAKLEQGASWDAVAAELKLNPAGKRFIGRQDGIAPQGIVNAAFDVAPSRISEAKPYYGDVLTDEGNYAVIAVSQVRNGEVSEESAEARTARRRRVDRQVGGEEFAAYVAETQRTAEVVRNNKIFE